ncbi:hypothetical protein LRS13_00270 [Svornostia abyssi]|uniref:Asl1-like glycosyl hydrolase catalytic domain-containing protein n=1 Tax=Svornostia abyssi TaxID=2898438 RepID=A0ABY5PH48_9ACTN|nr:hypothetical protein LRS13_00270 [Parviterribacteraceae bacterium J379]
MVRTLSAGLAACVLIGLLCLGTPAAAPAVTIGIADQRPEFATTPAFLRTRIGHARTIVAWDALSSDWQRADLDAWFGTVRAAGLTPQVTFGTSRIRPGELPSVATFRASVDAFRARYPWVREFSTWNEANACSARTCRRADRVAAYWRELRRACRGCTVLAADLVDAPNIPTWVRAFRRAARATPTHWGLHDYLDANRFRTTYTRATLRAIGPRARLWLTETGGLVARRNASTTPIPEGLAHAARATAFIFDTLLGLSPQIGRIYFYNFIAAPRPATWDSAFLNARREERPAYRVLRNRLARLASAGMLTGRRPAGDPVAPLQGSAAPCRASSSSSPASLRTPGTPSACPR